MATVFSVVTLLGSVGRCDARCHEAKVPECHCVCGGAFHGVGSKIAWEDRKTLTDEEILEGLSERLDGRPGRVLREVEQLTLF